MKYILSLAVLALVLTSCNSGNQEDEATNTGAQTETSENVDMPEDNTSEDEMPEDDMSEENASENEMPEETSLNSNQETMSQSGAELTWAVVVDTNHPLAGKTLNSDIEIIGIQSKWDGNTQENTIESGDTIEVHYVGTLEDGTQFDNSRERGQPLAFNAGSGQMIPGFDEAVIGMSVGDTETLNLAPEKAYGEYDENNTQTIPKSDLASFVNAGVPLEVGETLPTQFGELEILEVLDEMPEEAAQ